MSSEKLSNNSETSASKESKDASKLLPEGFLQNILQINLPEEKISFCLSQMRLSISQEKSPRFKEFWDIRKYCLQLFKESIPAFVRASLWKEFIELTAEARRLKDILDEQASFTIEQIDLAIDGLEDDISKYEKQVKEILKPDVCKDSKTLSHELDKISSLQGEINILSTLIQRMNSLRKELIATDMRVRFKNKFFKRLNSVGDFLFPKRKELVNELSEIFLEGVQKFYDEHFKDDVIKSQFYALKDEIKSIQAASKQLTLSNKAFTETRNLLSICWEKVKGLEDLKKKEFKKKKEVFEENKIKVIEKIDELAKKAEALSYEKVDEEIIEISKFMRLVELGREEIRDLKERLRHIKAPFEEKKKKEDELRLKQEKEAIEKKRKALFVLKADILSACETQNDPDSVNEIINGIEKKASDLNLTKSEKQTLERELKPLRDYFADLKEKALLTSLSNDELKSLEKLKSVLMERKARKKSIKDQLEVYRKELGGSGFDFEKAMVLRELIDAEKARLEKSEDGIVEIEEKISEIERR